MTTKAEVRAAVRELAEEHALEIPFGILEASGEPRERERQFEDGLEEFRAGLPSGVEFPVTSRKLAQAGNEEPEGESLTGSEVFNALDDEGLAARLVNAGFATTTAIVEASDEELLAVSGVGDATLRHLNEVFGREAPDEDSDSD